MATLTARMDALEAKLDTLIAALTAPTATDSVPVGARVSKSRKAKRTFATKADRKAGKGFACKCGRNDLRVEPKAGSWHYRPDGATKHEF